jgi:putative ABC transport system ATP-binding protein
MNNNNIILQTEDLRKTYLRGKIPVKALDGVSLTVERGEFVSIVGPSGSGKSTLLSLIGCLDKPSSGHIILDGVDVTSIKEKLLPRIRREKLGFVFQHFNLIPTLTALGNVDIAMRFTHTPKKERRERAKTLLRTMGLGDRLHHKPSELSGGEQQRVAIARALANNPTLILADEPTGEVDTKTRDKIVSILKKLSDSGITVLVVTHDVEVASKTKRVIHMKDGKIVSDTASSEQS